MPVRKLSVEDRPDKVVDQMRELIDGEEKRIQPRKVRLVCRMCVDRAVPYFVSFKSPD